MRKSQDVLFYNSILKRKDGNMNWDDLYEDPRFCLRDPAEEVVKVVSLLRLRETERILDLGFGAGRHIIYLAGLGFKMYGTDISERGEQITREWLEREGLRAELVMSDMTTIPYPDNFFGACICRGVITHNTVSGIRSCIAEMQRTLMPGGIVMCTFISRESSEYQKGEEVEPYTFVPREGIEAGVPHHFVDEEETRSLMQCFRLIEVYRMKHSGLIDVGIPYVSAHWVFVGEKKSS
ncbi:MAG: class I SAM-dependent methyltransferase [Candidatus Jorgensenbacteria bacterium]